MRASTTTRELATFLSRPAFRVMEVVASQLGARIPEESSSEPAPAHVQTVAPEAGTQVTAATPPPPPPRAEVRSNAPAIPAAPAAPGIQKQGPRVVRLLSTGPRANGPVEETTSHAPSVVRVETSSSGAPSAPRAEASSSHSHSAVRAETSSAGAPSAFRAETSPSHAPSAVRAETSSSGAPSAFRVEAPSSGAPSAVRAEASPSQSPSAVRAESSSSGAPAALRAEASPSSAPSAFRAEAPSSHSPSAMQMEVANVSSSEPAAPRIELRTPAPLVVREAPLARSVSEQAETRTPSAPLPPPPPREAMRGAPGPRVVRLLARSGTPAAEVHARGPSEPATHSAPEPQRSSSAAPAPARASTGPGSRPEPPPSTSPRRLTFVPAPEPTSSPTPVNASHSISENTRGPQPGPAISRLAENVTRGMAPIWEHAHQVSHPAPGVERASPPTSAVTTPPGGAVRNTFNVNVHLDAATPQAGLDRRTLEDVLVDILRETARRHGLEV